VWEYKTPKTRILLEVLQKKGENDPLAPHFSLSGVPRTGGVWEREAKKNRSGAVPHLR